MKQKKKEIIKEKTEIITEGQERIEERNGRFLPIYLWTD